MIGNRNKEKKKITILWSNFDKDGISRKLLKTTKFFFKQKSLMTQGPNSKLDQQEPCKPYSNG